MKENNYYTEHSKEYIENTIRCDMSKQYHFFEKYLVSDATHILDIGFGSGRDSLYFSHKFDVTSIDPTPEFCNHGEEIGLPHVYCMKAEEINFQTVFDGIWACASLLHIESELLSSVFQKCSTALKKEGIMYCSFKYGDFQGFRNDRYFIDLNETSLLKHLENTGLKLIDSNISLDVRPDRKEKWLNAILKKVN